jgi:aminopeptidase N
VQARSTQILSSFNLDFSGLEIDALTLNGAEVKYSRQGGELKVNPETLLAANQVFTVTVGYHGKPKPIKDKSGGVFGWNEKDGYITCIDEPQGAETWYPVNNTPRDKATYTFRITVPKPFVAAANGVLTRTDDSGNSRTYTWEMAQPMASYTAAVTVGTFTVDQYKTRDGLTIRNYLASPIAAEARKAVSDTERMIAYFEQLIGPYPFQAYGIAVVTTSLGYSMENQTLSLFDKGAILGKDPNEAQVFLAHELAHQWFGDSVTPSVWKDAWLNEGFATYLSWLWLQQIAGKAAFDAKINEWQQTLRGADTKPVSDPTAGEMFGVGTYYRGALTLHALRLTVGDRTFFQILKEWAAQHEYGNVRTQDFVDLAVKVTADDGQDSSKLPALFSAWLGRGTLPSLPAAAE